MKPWPRSATLNSGVIHSFQLPAPSFDPTRSCRGRETGSWQLRSVGLALPAGVVPAERLAFLERLEREQARKRDVIADFHVRVGGLARFDAVEEVAGVDIEWIVLLDAPFWIDIELRVDWRRTAAAAATTAYSPRTARSGRTGGDRGPASPERHAPSRRGRRRALLPNHVRHDRPHRPALTIDLQRAARADEEHAPVLDFVLRSRVHVHLGVGEGHDE